MCLHALSCDLANIGDPMLKFSAAVFAAFFAMLAPAMAHSPSRSHYVELAPGEARGCYYHRGERYCARYCYWEINGRRYCQVRERDAYPQAGLEVDEAVPVARRRHHHTMK